MTRSRSRPIVAVTRPELPGGGLARLADFAELRVWADPDITPTAGELVELCDGTDAVLGGGARFDGFVLEETRPSIVALPSAGYDSIDIEAAQRLGIVVTNVPGVLHETTADLAFALILMARRGLLAAADRIRAGGWHSPQRLDGNLQLDVHGAHLGLVGYGQIARAVARRASAFTMQVNHAVSRKPSDELSTATDLETLLRVSDIVSVHVPLATATVGLIGERQLALMKPTATIVNTARGGVIDESALHAALDAGRLHSAGLDVYTEEPTATNPLIHHPRVVPLPHVGSATLQTRNRMADLAVDNILAVLSGRPPLTPVKL